MSDPQQPYRPYEESRPDGAGSPQERPASPTSDPYGNQQSYGSPYPASAPDPYSPQDPYSSGNLYGQQDRGAYQLSPQSYGQPYGGAVNHPQGTLIFVLGILGFVVIVTGPVAWVMGNRAVREINESGARPANEGLVVAGRILGIISTVLMLLGVLMVLGFVLLAVLAAASFS